MQNPGTTTFSTAQRLPKPGKSGVPGPGHYRTGGGLGEQKESKRSTSPRPVFGTCTRDGRAKVYMDAELMRAYYGGLLGEGEIWVVGSWGLGVWVWGWGLGRQSDSFAAHHAARACARTACSSQLSAARHPACCRRR
jgi:hypothetical protein